MCAIKAHDVIMQSEISRTITPEDNQCGYMRSDERGNERWETLFPDHGKDAALLFSGANHEAQEQRDGIYIWLHRMNW